VELVTELVKEGANNLPSWLSADGCRLFFSSNRGGGKGNYDIWQAEKPPL
jgi:hypothetical protein